MPDRSFRFNSRTDNHPLQGYVWRAETGPLAVLVLAHGAAEHALRYERFARALNAIGIEVWALDHRGHGQSPGPDGLGDFGDGGWDGLVADIGHLIEMARAAHPGLPAVLFGHSMGAGAVQQYVPDDTHAIDALILSGSTAREAVRDGKSSLPPRFEPNKSFEPGRTAYDWLSRDHAEVDKYIADPLCGFDMWRTRPRPFGDPFQLADPDRLRRIPPDLPCLFVAGDKDPINRELEGLHLLEQRWHDAGIKRIDTLYYPGGRHEMLNETNRDQVEKDICDWLREVLKLS